MQLLRALLILAVLTLMPLGMRPARAMSAMDHHQVAQGHQAAMPMAGHCPDDGKTDRSSPGIAPCNMACAATLPALDAPVAAEVAAPDCPLAVTVISPLNGLEPAIATPPPRLS